MLTRVETLHDVVPLLEGLSSALHVGEQLAEGWEIWPSWLRAHGMEALDVLEIYGPNVEKLRAMPLWRNVYHGDLRNLNGLAIQPVDLVFWWHGPEHVFHHELVSALEGLERAFKPSLTIIGCPWGIHCNTERDFENHSAYHVSTWYPNDLERLGFTVRTCGEVNCPGGHISAWRKTRQDHVHPS